MKKLGKYIIDAMDWLENGSTKRTAIILLVLSLPITALFLIKYIPIKIEESYLLILLPIAGYLFAWILSPIFLLVLYFIRWIGQWMYDHKTTWRLTKDAIQDFIAESATALIMTFAACMILVAILLVLFHSD